jgi:PKD repeat protein
MKTLIYLATFLLIVANLNAQNTCGDAHLIDHLPFAATELSTQGTGNDYTDSDACGSDAMVNEEYVFSFTTTEAVSVRISLANTQLVTEAPVAINATIGLFLLDDCPDQTGANCVASVDDLTANPEIDLILLNAATTYYIVVSSSNDNLFVQEYSTYVNFDITVDQVYNNDAGITTVEPITSACGLSTSSISCTLKNFGANTISNFELAYTVDGSNEVIESFSGTIVHGATANYTFSTEADISDVGTHSIQVYTMLPGDENSTNDDYEISVTNSEILSIFPFSEGFESGLGSFYTDGTNSSWEAGAPDPEAEVIIDHSAEGDRFAATNISGEANANENSFLYSPCFDLSSLVLPTVRFNIWTQITSLVGGGVVTLEASIDGGLSYTINIASWESNTADWVQFNTGVPELVGETNVKFRFNYTAGFIAAEGVAIDNFIVKEQNMIDASVGSLILPVSGCGLSDSEYVKLYIKNSGAGSISNIPVTYSIDGGETWLSEEEICIETIEPGDSVVFTFATLADLSVPGTYTLAIKTVLDDDEEPINDRADFEIVNTLNIDDFTYIEDFETDNHGWAPSTNSSWATSIPDDTLIINIAYSGDNIMATNPNGNANANENSYLYSPCFDFSGLNGIDLSLAVWYETGTLMSGTATLEGSIDSGETWFQIDSWSGSSGMWEEKSYQLLDFADVPDSKLRIHYQGAFLAAEGIAIDYIKIDPLLSNDVGISDITGPVSTCGMDAAENIQVEIKNYGTETQTGFPVSYSLDQGATWVTQNYLLQLQGFQTAVFTFSTPVDFSTTGEYSIWVKTELSTDENSQNDAYYGIIANLETINSFPYQETFETGENAWIASGTNSSIELGEPAAAIINTAGEGEQSWVTNLTGNHNASELSYLNSPCFDFSNMTNPMVKALINYETMAMMSEFYLEASTDNGLTWSIVEAGGGGANWYGDALIPDMPSTWNGSSQGWISASTNIPALAGAGSVQLRFVFDSGMMPFMQNEGIGIDDINIYDCNELPSADFEYTISGTTVNFINNSENADNYNWNFGDNDIMPTSSTEESPSFDYTQPGQYTVTLTVSNQCGSDIITQVVDINTENAVLNINNICIFPNPVEDDLSINTGSLTAKKIRVLNINGEVIYDILPDSNITKIVLNDLKAGLYFVSIHTDEGISHLRFIKQ